MEYLLFHKDQRPEVQSIISKIERLESDYADQLIHQENDRAFEKIDCLKCANCCKTSSPILEQEDIERIAGFKKTSVGQFISEFLEMDEDGDFVFRTQPCPMLNQDNTCSVYSIRPEACADYPHTKRKFQKDYLDIMEENSFICPAVTHILTTLNSIF